MELFSSISIERYYVKTSHISFFSAGTYNWTDRRRLVDKSGEGCEQDEGHPSRQRFGALLSVSGEGRQAECADSSVAVALSNRCIFVNPFDSMRILALLAADHERPGKEVLPKKHSQTN